MPAKIINPWGDGRDADVLDDKCCARSCLHIGEDKGTFVQGRGYTSYHKNPWLTCFTRKLHGCPHPLPEPESEAVRCCLVPEFPPAGKRPPRKQRCRTCGQWASGWLLETRRSLPALPNVACHHKKVYSREDDLFQCTLWICPDCEGYWKQTKPKSREPGRTFKDLLDEAFPSFR